LCVLRDAVFCPYLHSMRGELRRFRVHPWILPVHRYAFLGASLDAARAQGTQLWVRIWIMRGLGDAVLCLLPWLLCVQK
jgi:hypothetical protein